MKCPYCGFADTQVKDSRPSEDDTAIRRRRLCPECDSRFTTFERIQLRELTVMKKNGERRIFDREKLRIAIDIACRKRPIGEETVEQLTSRIVKLLETEGETEIATGHIGELVMHELKALDTVAYIRFASVYKDFREADDFKKLVKEMGKDNGHHSS